ncbi:MAG: hypothetical protein SLAVMIC_00528 [uncultured marine phage]|uniref:Uncharacterized protein n=1 Tax=uncultured marine phage TaxID=707152 RepID=A0A8D9CCD4_9VIRU|nr:MAG: hypothetical protein SLAVMIC_00528 [uncultured marine phage]
MNKPIHIDRNLAMFHKRGLNNFRVLDQRLVHNGYLMGNVYTIQQEVYNPKWMFWKNRREFKKIEFSIHLVYMDGYMVSVDGRHGKPFYGQLVNIDNVEKLNDQIINNEIRSYEITKQTWILKELRADNINEANRVLEGVKSQYKTIHREERLSKILEN